MDPEPRPPLTKRFRRGHWVAIDRVGAAVYAALLLTMLLFTSAPDEQPIVWSGSLAVVVLPLSIVLRRRFTLGALGAVLTWSTVSSCFAASSLIEFLAIVPTTLVLYQAAATHARRTAILALAAPLVQLVVWTGWLLWQGRTTGQFVIPGLILITAWTIGAAVGEHREYALRLREYQARQAEALVERSLAGERLRIARELHDVVAHGMSVIAVQATFGNHVIETRPVEARAALETIETTCRDSLVEMRRLLGVLRGAGEDPEPATLAPAPGLAELGRLVAGTAKAGVRVDAQVLGRVRVLPAGVELSAYRIVQEALTNVVKHAGTSSCRVTLDYGDDELAIEVVDAGRGCPAPVGGHGIIGMRERVGLCHGRFSAEALPGRGFRVAAGLPLPPVAVAR
ncbi:sensor histidine kinase [Embleya sp. AB8]|uniref:sensor histidine kinase n=1 Tax=Embleya sp. AB8 TaxID=3156304 RepID=UPI003C782289